MTESAILRLTESSIGGFTELVYGDASINLTLAEFSNVRLSDLNYTFKDAISYLWNPYMTGGPVFPADDVSALADPSTLFVGPPLSHPFKGLRDISWKLSTSNDNGVVSSRYVTSPLFIHENDIRFYDMMETSVAFKFANNGITLQLENASLRDPNNDDWVMSEQYSIYSDPSSDFYVMDGSSGKIFFDGYVTFTGDSSSYMTYAYDNNYSIPLLKMEGFVYIDSSGTYRRNSQTYTLDIRDGKIGMSDPSNNVTEYINFNYDSSIGEQTISHDVIYESDRMPLYEIDPSIYYWTDSVGPTSLVTDNSVHTMKVHRSGDYVVEAYGFDGYNNTYYNRSLLDHRVWLKTPTVYTITNSIQGDGTISIGDVTSNDVSTYVANNSTPVYDRLIPLQGITVEKEGERSYVKIPSITYFQDVMEPASINKFYNLTERVVSVSGNNVVIDPDFQFFKAGDTVDLVRFSKSQYEYVSDVSVTIVSGSGSSFLLSNVPVGMQPDSSNALYMINTTERSTSSIVNNYDNSTCTLSIGSDAGIFRDNQLLTLIAYDSSTSYSWGGSYRILSSVGTSYTIDGLLPRQFLAQPSRYTFTAKHAFTTYSTTNIKTDEAYEQGGYFKLYLDDTYNEQWFLDSTFALVNILFDHDEVNAGWDSPNTTIGYKMYDSPISVEPGDMVILTAGFGLANYMVGQRNIWTIRKTDTKEVVMKVYNFAVVYRFSDRGFYDVQIESYDSYGNLTSCTYEGLIKMT